MAIGQVFNYFLIQQASIDLTQFILRVKKDESLGL